MSGIILNIEDSIINKTTEKYSAHNLKGETVKR
jgi:hypothetical protein